ncbi:MAG: 4Fe-4S binding protein, partial [Candidatus Sumerlaeota bacterium]|nr:4Fe-4S binding protein [Candidatus Sumerlaeota bacterium]
KDVPETVMQASAAASKALTILAGARNTLTERKTYPPEIPVVGEPPRIGIFICNCGINIGGVVNVPGVAEYARALPFVEYVQECLFACAQDMQESIKAKIKEHGLNRIVVAACSPRTHQPLFQQTMRECGLNPALFEMANIRDHCSWVHQTRKDEATDKSMDLVRMAVHKAAFLEPLHPQKLGVTKAALMVGGGLAGMTAALALADKGYPVALVEKEKELGGLLRETHYTIRGGDVQDLVKKTIARVQSHGNITVMTGARLEAVEGKAAGFLYGESENVLTQTELESLLHEDRFDGGTKNIVMIQCAGSRNDERPYCSRICCQEAVKNALKLKQLKPDARVFILYRDMRTYGYMEEYYSQARDAGVLFIRFDPEAKPQVEVKPSGEVVVHVKDLVARKRLAIPADLLALSMATVPNPDNPELAQMLKVPVNADKFFLEAHMKLRPVDFATDGVFVCGLAHAPKLIDEAISQAEAAAGRAAVALSHDFIETEANVAVIDSRKCTACGLCVSLCPYKAIEITPQPDRYGRVYAVVNAALCKGCGVCASSCRCDAPDLAGFTDRELVAQMMAVFN